MLSPIIILITEQDAAPYSWLKRNLDDLQKLGYQSIEFEWCKDSSIEEYQAITKRSLNVAEKVAKDVEQGKNITKETLSAAIKLEYYRSLSECIEKVVEKKLGCFFVDLEKDFFFDKDFSRKLTDTELKSAKDKRENLMTDMILEKSMLYDGGTITILGNNHHTVYDKLKAKNEQFASKCFFIELQELANIPLPINFNENHKKYFGANNQEEVVKKRREIYIHNISNRKQHLNSYLPKNAYLSLDYTDKKHQLFLDTLIIKKLRELNKQPEVSASFKPTVVSSMT